MDDKCAFVAFQARSFGLFDLIGHFRRVLQVSTTFPMPRREVPQILFLGSRKLKASDNTYYSR
jgi:hypothetical protein